LESGFRFKTLFKFYIQISPRNYELNLKNKQKANEEFVKLK